MSRILFTFLMIWVFSTNAIASVVSVCPNMTTSVVMDQNSNAHSAHQQQTAEMTHMDHGKANNCPNCETSTSTISSHDCGNCIHHTGSSMLMMISSFALEHITDHYEIHFRSFSPTVNNQRLLRPPRLV